MSTSIHKYISINQQNNNKMIDNCANIEELTLDEIKNEIIYERNWYKMFSKLNQLIMKYTDQIALLNKNKGNVFGSIKSIQKKGEEYRKLNNSFLNYSIKLVLLKERKQNAVNLMKLIINHIDQETPNDYEMSNDYEMLNYFEIEELF